jgi:hypothetical protein
MGYFLDLYKKGGASMESSAFDYLVGNLRIKEKRGADKATEITALNMEENAPIDFVPAMIYTFLYVSDAEETVGAKHFKDNVPVILCLASTGKLVTGLNFNMIPNDVRASILDIIVNLTKEPMYDDSGKFKANEVMLKLFSLPKCVTGFIKAIENETGLNVNSAVRTYNTTFIKRCRMVEYDAWKYVPFLSFKDAIRGAGLAELQADMVKDNRR